MYKKPSYNTVTKKQLIKMWTKGLEFFQRKYANGQQAHGKVLNTTNHQGNANKNHNEITFHTQNDGY